MSIILTFCESKGGKLKPVSRELCSAAARMASEMGGTVTAVLLGGDAADAASLGAFGASKVIFAQSAALAPYSTEGHAQAAAEIIAAEKPSFILFSATARGRDLAPRVAARLGFSLLSDCTDLKIEGGALQVMRPIYAGKVNLWIRPTGSCTVLTLRPKAFLAQESGGVAAVERREVNVDGAKIRARVVEEKMQEGGRLDVAEADLIVSGGRGMKSPENFQLIEDLAKALGAAVGASRAVVDAGWRPHSEQVGQTGKVVSPTLYVAAGISGAIQHLAGMSTSRIIVAVNKDAEAPIFKVATYGVVGDALEILPVLTDAVRKARAEG